MQTLSQVNREAYAPCLEWSCTLSLQELQVGSLSNNTIKLNSRTRLAEQGDPELVCSHPWIAVKTLSYINKIFVIVLKSLLENKLLILENINSIRRKCVSWDTSPLLGWSRWTWRRYVQSQHGQSFTHIELQCFFSFANIYQLFFWNYSSIATLLNTLSTSKNIFRWIDNADSAFREFKSWFTSKSVLMIPNVAQQMVQEVNASETGVRGILSLWLAGDSKMHPCAFYFHGCPPQSAVVTF